MAQSEQPQVVPPASFSPRSIFRSLRLVARELFTVPELADQGYELQHVGIPELLFHRGHRSLAFLDGTKQALIAARSMPLGFGEIRNLGQDFAHRFTAAVGVVAIDAMGEIQFVRPWAIRPGLVRVRRRPTGRVGSDCDG
jgi:hypothetical protein